MCVKEAGEVRAYGIFLNPEEASKIAASVEALGLSFVLVEAVDGRNEPSLVHSPPLELKAASARLGYPMTGSQAGCALSHLKVYRMFIETNDAWALVMEDDAELHVEAATILKLTNEWDGEEERIVMLASRNSAFAEPNSAVSLGGGLTMYDCRYVPHGTTAYLISRAAALKAARSTIDYAADWPSWASSFRFSCVDPVVARERPRDSTVGDGFKEGRRTSMKSLVWWRFLRNRSAYPNAAEYSYREWLPRIEEGLWRRSRSPTMSQNENSPRRPTRWFSWLARVSKKRI